MKIKPKKFGDFPDFDKKVEMMKQRGFTALDPRHLEAMLGMELDELETYLIDVKPMEHDGVRESFYAKA